MKCKCSELVPWLKREINYLEKMLYKTEKNSKLNSIVNGKIEAYSLILECFENE